MKNSYYYVGPHHHGLFIREARLRLGYSLSEVASEICDASYLCRIEKGKVTPNERLFIKIAEKLELNIPETDIEWIDSSIKSVLYSGELQEVGRNIDEEHLKRHEQCLLEFIKAVLKEDESKAWHLKKTIDQWSYHLVDKEKQIYDLFIGIYFMVENHWEAVGEHLARSLQAIKRLDIQDPVLDLHLAYYYFHTENLYAGFHHLERASTLFRKKCAKYWVVKCDLLWCTERIKAGVVDEVEVRLHSLSNMLCTEGDSLNLREINSILGMWYERKSELELAEHYYFKSIDFGRIKELEYCIVRVMDFLYRQNRTRELLDLLSDLTMSELSRSSRALAEYYHFKVHNDESEIFENFLIKEAIPQGKKTTNLKYVTLHMQELIKIYRRRASYKKEADVYQQLSLFERKFDQMRKLEI